MSSLVFNYKRLLSLSTNILRILIAFSTSFISIISWGECTYLVGMERVPAGIPSPVLWSAAALVPPRSRISI